MKVFIIGGTGFLGYYATLEFLKRGHEVSTVSIPDVELGDWFPKEVSVEYHNVFEMKLEDMVELFKGYDAMVYAVGPDDRFVPPAPAYEFFHDRLVVSAGKVVKAARDAGVKRCSICNSYFAYFDRTWPEAKLAKRHPYIKCRVEQAAHCIEIGGDKMDVMILELPYIFGNMPGREPIWKEVLFDRLFGMPIIPFSRGGTAMIAVEGVAEAIVGSIEKGEAGKRYPVGDVNMTWKEWLSICLDAYGMEKKRIITVPAFVLGVYGWFIKHKEKKEGKESGLDTVKLMYDIQSQETFLDNDTVCEQLGIQRRGVKASLIKTVEKCLEIDAAAE